MQTQAKAQLTRQYAERYLAAPRDARPLDHINSFNEAMVSGAVLKLRPLLKAYAQASGLPPTPTAYAPPAAASAKQ